MGMDQLGIVGFCGFCGFCGFLRNQHGYGSTGFCGVLVGFGILPDVGAAMPWE
jgi:hypothetical protein